MDGAEVVCGGSFQLVDKAWVSVREEFYKLKELIGSSHFEQYNREDKEQAERRYYELLQDDRLNVRPQPGALNMSKGRSWHMTEIPNPCLHCDSLNPGEKLRCTQCGAPLHPMYAVS